MVVDKGHTLRISSQELQMLSLVTLSVTINAESVVLKFAISGVTLTTGHKSLELRVSSKYIILCLCLSFLLVILCLL